MGPLSGIRIVEIAGIGPGPFCGLLLSDLGADVIRVDRAYEVNGGDPAKPPMNVLNRGRRSIGVDLKNPEGVETVLRFVDSADALFEGFRPGVMERLGLSPEVCLARNPKLVYGRMTGWGQEGPYSQMAGHDINYIALAGALDSIGRRGQPPTPPLNLVGDFGGGGLVLAYGLVCGLLETQRSGKGQVIDSAMVDGAAILMSMFYGMHAAGTWSTERGMNRLDSGSHWYDAYETSDGKYVAIGSVEDKFYEEMLRNTGLGGAELPDRQDPTYWPELKERMGTIFRSKTRDEWCTIMEGTDSCFAPVLSLEEAPDHPHNKFRDSFTEVAGVRQPAPTPRFDRTPGAIQRPPPHPGQHSDELLSEGGYSAAEIKGLRASGAVA